MNIALTGASGFIGSALLKKIERIYGRESITLISSRNHPDYKCIKYSNYKISLGDNQLDCDILIHAGAFIPKISSDMNLMEPCTSNVIFTQDLLRILNVEKCKKIIFLSTVDVYKSSGILNEESEVLPLSLYGASKLYCEKMIGTYAISKKIKHLILRIGHVYGPGEEVYKKIIPTIMGNVISNQPVQIFGDGSELRSYIHIEDVVSAIVESLTKNLDIDIINVVSGNSISIAQLTNLIINISKKNITINSLPSSTSKRDLVFNNTLLKETLLPSERDFFNCLADEYDYMVNNNEYSI